MLNQVYYQTNTFQEVMSPETLLLRNDPYKLIRVPCITFMRKHIHAKAHPCESTSMRKHIHAKAHPCESTSMRKHTQTHPCESTLKHIHAKAHSNTFMRKHPKIAKCATSYLTSTAVMALSFDSNYCLNMARESTLTAEC
jgi:hypothetical protein